VVGVFIVWWLAYQARMSIARTTSPPTLTLEPEGDAFARHTPRWMELFLERFARRRSPDHAG
jgi:hypothetical protein